MADARPLPIVTDLRNAYESHDRDEFERALKRVQALLAAAQPQPQPQNDAAEPGRVA